MKNDIIIKILDQEIWFYKNNRIYIEKTSKIIENNFIISNTELEKGIKAGITNNNLLNKLLQNKIYILINKLYSETNIFVIKQVLYNLGYSNYKIIYEEDYYKDIYPNILSIWKDNGIYIKNNVENYIDINNKNDIKKIMSNTILITSNQDILKRINKDIIQYEESEYPIFKMVSKRKSV